MKGWQYYETDISKVIESNLIAYFDWNFINIGAFHNVNIPTSGAYGGDFSRLKPSNDPRYTSGTVWESVRGNWVWESGLAYDSINISGVFVGSTFLTSGYNIDYLRGRVIFSSAKPLNSIVRLGYSYKEVQFDSADENPFIKHIQNRSRRIDDTNFMISSGNFIGLPDNRIQFPHVSVSVVSRNSEGFQLGGGHIVNHTIVFHILAEDDYSCGKIANIIADQKNSNVFLFNPDRMARENVFPLSMTGERNNSLLYPQIVKHSGDGGYRYTDGIQYGKTFIKDSELQGKKWLGNICYGITTLETETIVTKL